MNAISMRDFKELPNWIFNKPKPDCTSKITCIKYIVLNSISDSIPYNEEEDSV
jgi:hypothetical protein